MGKSTAMKHLALVWAGGFSKEMLRFSFVFHISLKCVNENTSLEDIIISQHKGLHANGVRAHEIKAILEGKSPVLLLMDGYDEYTKGSNINIDKAIEKDTLWNCWIILTSRVIKELEIVKSFMDAEAAIHGFSEEKIKEYAAKFLESKEDSEELVEQAQESRISDILSIPIILQMLCVLFTNVDSLPETRTAIIWAVVKRCINCAFLRLNGLKPHLTDSQIHEILVKLGSLAWKSLQGNVKQLLLNKVSHVHHEGFSSQKIERNLSIKNICSVIYTFRSSLLIITLSLSVNKGSNANYACIHGHRLAN